LNPLFQVTDDVTSYNPFPHKSLSEQMEVKAVWDKVNLKPSHPGGNPGANPTDATRL